MVFVLDFLNDYILIRHVSIGNTFLFDRVREASQLTQLT